MAEALVVAEVTAFKNKNPALKIVKSFFKSFKIIDGLFSSNLNVVKLDAIVPVKSDVAIPRVLVPKSKPIYLILNIP